MSGEKNTEEKCKHAKIICLAVDYKKVRFTPNIYIK
jgi:hypothetical protein